MSSIHEHARKVQFADTDMAGIVHFAQILCYVEEAEHAILQQLSIDPISQIGGFPKVHVDCDYRKPLKFGQTAKIRLVLKKIGERSLSWDFTITGDADISATGSIVTVYVETMGQSAQIPDNLRYKLQEILSA